MRRCHADVIEWGFCPHPVAYEFTVDFELARLQLCVEHTAEMRRAWPDSVIEVHLLRGGLSA